MATLLTFHAHPDDEAISTGGSMARAHAEGHRVVLVIATDGSHGEVPDDLAPGESLADRRRLETDVSAAALGVDRVVFLGYRDSGMTGWEQNRHDGAFASADVDEAAGRLADVLRDEHVDVLSSYDWHGNYGHPDHVQVHRVANRAVDVVRGELASLRVFEATMNRDAMSRMINEAKERGDEAFGPDDEDFDPTAGMDDGNPMGTPESELTLAVDVREFLDSKRAALAAHRSQISDSSFFLQMPPDVFAAAFGTEWFIEQGAEPGLRHGWFFDP